MHVLFTYRNQFLTVVALFLLSTEFVDWPRVKKETRSDFNIQPLSDRVVVRPSDKEEKVSVSGIIIPDTAKEKPEQGKVIAVGAGKKTEDGKVIPLEVKEGDVVLFTKYGPNEVKVDEKEYLIAKEEDILAIIRD